MSQENSGNLIEIQIISLCMYCVPGDLNICLSVCLFDTYLPILDIAWELKLYLSF